MEYFVGIFLAIGVSFLTTLIGFDRDRALYPIMTIVIASYYELFAVVGGSVQALGLETIMFSVFALVAVIGFKTNLWLIVAALAGHGVFDLAHPHLIANHGVPSWWPMFCATYDLTAALYLAWRLSHSVLAAGPNIGPRPSYVESELVAAASFAKRGDFPASFRHLERAHILAQNSTLEHVRVHFHMLFWAIQQRNVREIAGQILRIIGAAAVTAVGLAPSGNTGGSNVSLFRQMPIPDDLAALLAKPSKRSTAHILGTVLFAALALVGGIAANAATSEERIVTVDSRQVAFRVVGSGRPAIVLISGLGDEMATFEDVADALGKTNTVILYDRAGYGGSDLDDGPRDASAVARELHSLLAQSGVPGPFVLSGHSLGGLFAEYYAAKHPDQVLGLILEDSRPADFTRRCAARLLPSNCLPPKWATWLMPKGARDEVAALDQTTAQVEESVPLHDKPVLVLTHPGGDAETAFDILWMQAQNDLAARYPGSRHLTAADGGHYIHRDQREWFFMSVRAFLTEIQ